MLRDSVVPRVSVVFVRGRPVSLPPHIRIDHHRGARGAPLAKITCIWCGREFRIPLSQAKARHSTNKSWPSFCSRECHGMSLRRRPSAETRSFKIKGENVTLPPHIQISSRKGPNGGKYVVISCLNCGKRFRMPLYVAKRVYLTRQTWPKYCSPKCSHVALSRGVSRDEAPILPERVSPDTLRRCPKCKVTKPLRDYHRDSSRSNGYARLCAKCKNAYTRETYRKKRQKQIDKEVGAVE